MKIAAIALLATLAGCATAGEAAPARVETIRYDTSACFGFCPAYTVTVSSDGKGVFEGRGHVEAKGVQRFTVTRAQFDAFRRALQPLRPTGERLVTPGSPLCGVHATDQITVDVRWSGGGRPPAHLARYFGCRMEAKDDERAVLKSAPGLLPIAGFIGKPTGPR